MILYYTGTFLHCDFTFTYMRRVDLIGSGSNGSPSKIIIGRSDEGTTSRKKQRFTHDEMQARANVNLVKILGETVNAGANI